MTNEDIPSSLFNKYQNKYLLQSTRKKASKKHPLKGAINTRIRKEIKKVIRVEYSDMVMKKDKYITFQKYKNKTSKYSDAIIKSKEPEYEPEKKMMIRMIHGSLSTCEKLNRLVE